MAMIKIPIYDLLVFLDEKEDSFEKKANILEFIKDHYQQLTGIVPKFSCDYALETLCFCDNGLIKNGNFPNKEGLLLKNKKGQYALTFGGYHISETTPTKDDILWVWKIGEDGYLTYDIYNQQDWEKWGALTSLYFYFDYDEGINKNIGERELKKGVVGKDVLLIQQHLSLYDTNIPLSGEFEEKTEAVVKGIQHMHFYHADVDGVIRPKHIDIYLR